MASDATKAKTGSKTRGSNMHVDTQGSDFDTDAGLEDDAGPGAPPEPPKPEQFRIRVTDNHSGSMVNVLNAKDTQEQSDTSNRILTLLYDQLK